jgi:prepilin-type N-terminal cleavage/methylation domain-containing protein
MRRRQRARAGFTLWEMAIVLAIMAVSAVIVIPRLTDLGAVPPTLPGDAIMAALRDARRAAIERGVTVTLRVDPANGLFRADTTGIEGTGMLAEGSLDVGMWETLITEEPRLVWVFRPSGAAFGDTVRVRGSAGVVLVSVDPWSGVPVADAR